MTDLCLAGAAEWRAQARRALETAETIVYESDGGAEDLARKGSGEWLVICREDALPRPDAGGRLRDAMRRAAADVWALEARTLPAEDPKFYHPLTLETDSLNGACFAVRRAALEAAGGFVAGDVPALGAAIRRAGGRILLCPAAVVCTDAIPAAPAGAVCRVCPPMPADPPRGVHFTVLVRAWKRTETLDRALTCLERQTYRDFDVVVAEDGAEPVCAGTVDAHRGALELTYLPLGRDAGRSAAANAAMRESRGPWLAFLDDDDYFFADHFETAAHTILAAPGCRAAAFGSMEAAAASGSPRYEPDALRPCAARPFSAVRQCLENSFPIQAVVFRRELFERLGGMDETLDALEDWDLWTRYFLDSPPAVCEKTTSLFHTPADERARAERILRMDAWKARLAEKWRGLAVDATAADILTAAWDPERRRRECEQALELCELRESVKELQASRRRRATRAPRAVLCAAARFLTRLAGPEDVDADAADRAQLLRQQEAVRRSFVMRAGGGR